MPKRKWGVATHVRVPLELFGGGDFAASADYTPGTGDVKVSKDGGAAANITTLPSAIAMGNTAYWDFPLSATEMQASEVIVTLAENGSPRVLEQQFILIETYMRPFTLKFQMTKQVHITVDGIDAVVSSPVTGLTVAAMISADNGTTFDSTANSPVEDANGYYHLVLAGADMILGDDLVLRMTASGADDYGCRITSPPV